jgi:hypothetical protein
LLRGKETDERGCCPLQVHFHASIGHLRAKEAQVLRLRQRINGEVIGGYSVVLIGRQT